MKKLPRYIFDTLNQFEKFQFQVIFYDILKKIAIFRSRETHILKIRKISYDYHFTERYPLYTYKNVLYVQKNILSTVLFDEANTLTKCT